MSERVLGVSEGLAPRAPEMSDRNVNKTTKTIAREIDRNVIHLKNIYIYHLYMHDYMKVIPESRIISWWLIPQYSHNLTRKIDAILKLTPIFIITCIYHICWTIHLFQICCGLQFLLEVEVLFEPERYKHFKTCEVNFYKVWNSTLPFFP